MYDFGAINIPELGEIRTLEENGITLYCGRDVAKALGYDQTHKAIKYHCRYGMKYTVPHPQSQNKKIEMLFIPESDLYRLIFSSRLPSAKKAADWLTAKKNQQALSAAANGQGLQPSYAALEPAVGQAKAGRDKRIRCNGCGRVLAERSVHGYISRKRGRAVVLQGSGLVICESCGACNVL